jgi:hypothetical protein
MEGQKHFISLIYSSDGLLAYGTTMNQHLIKSAHRLIICGAPVSVCNLPNKCLWCIRLRWPQETLADATAALSVTGFVSDLSCIPSQSVSLKCPKACLRLSSPGGVFGRLQPPQLTSLTVKTTAMYGTDTTLCVS